jgi:hypothetical protein
MTSRERWTVYPLLFLALIMASRDKLAAPYESTFRVVKCQEIVVQDVNGQRLVQIGNAGASRGFIATFNHEGDATKESKKRIEISSDEAGGNLQAFSSGDDEAKVFGFRKKE